MRFLLTILLSLCFLFPSAVSANEYVVDLDYSSIMYRIKHLMGYNVGSFSEYEGGFTLNKDQTKLKTVWGDITVGSIQSQNDKRDDDLKSDRFFDVEQFPQMTFKFKKFKDDQHLIGDLTIRDVTKEIELTYHYWGVGKDQFGRRKAAVSLTGMINRREFGITFNQKTDDGKWLLGDEIDLIIELQGILKEDLKIKVNR